MPQVFSHDDRNCLHCQTRITPHQKAYCSRPCFYTHRRLNSRHYLRARGKARTHRGIAARILGRPAGKAVVHHYGRITDNSRIVLCENQAYHLLLHARARVVAAGGDPNRERLCSVCRVLRPISDFRVVKTGKAAGVTITTCGNCRTEKRRAGLWT